METKTILAIDDTVSNLDILTEILDQYKIMATTSGESALKAIKGRSIDLILLDIVMPEMDGYEVCKRLKEDPLTKDIPVIFLTSKSDEESLAKAFEVGGVDYVTKPFMKEELISRINTHLTLSAYQKSLEKKVEEETKKRLEQQNILVKQSRLAAMGEMIDAIAHQWKQPLHSISLVNSDLKLKQMFNELDDEILLNGLNNIEESIDFMDETINHFKNYFNTNKEKTIFSINNEVDKVYHMIKLQLTSNNIKLNLNIEDAIEGFGSPSEFKQVILNLISNAKDAIIQNNSETREITITSKKLDDKKVQLFIQDSGGGIPENIINNIFDDHFTTKGEQGTGIGLSLTKMIMEDEMKGKISVSNNEQGALFTLEFYCISFEEERDFNGN